MSNAMLGGKNDECFIRCSLSGLEKLAVDTRLRSSPPRCQRAAVRKKRANLRSISVAPPASGPCPKLHHR
jgi:hypothetical protein